MTRTNTPDEDRLARERAANRPEQAAERLDAAHPGEDVAPARLGAELAAERMPREASGTVEGPEQPARGRGRTAREVEP